jgi:hypothetical protein
MTKKRVTIAGVLILSIGLGAGSLSSATPAHDSHGHHHGSPATLQLDNGKKWQTDAQLRQSMATIRQSVDASLHDIHEGKLSNAGYGKLVRAVEKEVAAIVRNCKLAPEADAQLHLIVAELLEGAEQMNGKVRKTKRIDGAVKVIGALEKYADYFADPDFKPIAH